MRNMLGLVYTTQTIFELSCDSAAIVFFVLKTGIAMPIGSEFGKHCRFMSGKKLPGVLPLHLNIAILSTGSELLLFSVFLDC